VGALVGGIGLLFDIADHAYLPHLIGREHLVDGNTKLSTTESLAEIGGPALAGLLVQTLTAPFAIAVNAATYLVSALFLGAIPAQREVFAPAERRPTLLSDLRVGYEVMTQSALLRPLYAMNLVAPLFGGPFSALYVIFAIKTLGLTPALMGITVGVGGIGSLAGTALSPWLIRRIGIGPTIVLGSLVSAMAAIFVPLAGGPLWLKLASLMVAQFVGDSMAVAALIPAASLRQSIIPRAKLGRAAALFSISTGVVAVAGALLGGAMGEWLGVRTTLYIAAGGFFLTPLFVVFSPLTGVREIPAVPPEQPPPL